jgi:F-type H+-transporting ATPase subunit a
MFKLMAAGGAGVPLAAEPLFNVGPLTITNSMFFGVVIALVVLLIFGLALRKSTVRPKNKFAFAIETLVDFLVNAVAQNFGGDRKKALKHAPLFITLFTFIILSNLSGLLPGVGTIGVHHGEEVTPLLRPFTTDLNGTLALAVLTIGLVQFYAIKEHGVLRHLRNYFHGSLANPMTWFTGLIEILGEFIRIITLSMRLFGVIYAGEVLLHVVSDLAGDYGWAATLPVYFMEIFFSSIQAYIFIMLSSTYLGMATAKHDAEHDDSHDNHSPEAKQLKAAPAGNDSK